MNSIQAGVSEFADVIGKTGGKAMPIGPGNRMDGWVPVGEAIATGQCFAVDVAPEIVACDFDLGDLTQVDDCVGALKELGLNPVICASGGANRRHIFVRCESAEIQALVRSMAKGFGADVRKTIRPLLSPHRQSGHSELLEPKDPDLALRFLSGTIDTPNGTKLLLPSTVLQRLQFGDLDGRYASRSELIQAITNAAYEWVWDFEALFLLLMDTENVAGEKIREKEARYRGSGRSYLEGSWGKAALYVPKSPKELKGENVVPLAALLRELTVRMPELSTMEVVVLEAHLEIVGRAKSTSYTLSTRQAAELAGCNKETARIVSRGLAGKGYLTRTAPSNGMEASTWSIHLDNFRTYSSSTTDITYIGGGVTKEYVRGMSPAHDLFSQSGLWRQCYRILRVSSAGDLTTQEIAEVMGVSVKTVQRSLKALTDVDLIKIDTSQRWHVVVQDLDRIANDLGVTGTQKKRKASHSKERSKYLASKVGGNSGYINAPLNIAVGTPGPTAPKKRLQPTCEALNGKPRMERKTVRPGGGRKIMIKKVITTSGLSSQG